MWELCIDYFVRAGKPSKICFMAGEHTCPQVFIVGTYDRTYYLITAFDAGMKTSVPFGNIVVSLDRSKYPSGVS
jgi:hypothetical protein